MNKFEIVKNESVRINGVELYRIRALIDFGDVCAGEFGGYIQHERNLSQSGNAWVYGNAMVSDNALVSGSAQVYGDALVQGNAQIFGDARVYGNAWVRGDALVSGSAQVYGDAWVQGNAQIFGDARVYGDSWVRGDALVTNIHCIVWFSNVGTGFGTLTVYCGKTELLATRGCFYGTLDEFCAESAKHHTDQIKREYGLLAEMARLRLSSEQNKISGVVHE